MTTGGHLKKVNKPSKNLPVPVKSRDLTRHCDKKYPLEVFVCEHGSSVYNCMKQRQRSCLMDAHVFHPMLISLKRPKLENAKSNAVIRWACTEFCSWCEKQKFN